MKDQNKKIAIVKNIIIDYYDSDGYHYDKKIVDSITKWEEVSYADFEMLCRASARMGFTVLEQPINTPAFIAKSIADYKKLIAEEERKRQKEKEIREQKALERKNKKELKSKEAKKKLLEQLKKELEEF